MGRVTDLQVQRGRRTVRDAGSDLGIGSEACSPREPAIPARTGLCYTKGAGLCRRGVGTPRAVITAFRNKLRKRHGARCIMPAAFPDQGHPEPFPDASGGSVAAVEKAIRQSRSSSSRADFRRRRAGRFQDSSAFFQPAPHQPSRFYTGAAD